MIHGYLQAEAVDDMRVLSLPDAVLALEHFLFIVTMRPYGELLLRLPVLCSRKVNRQQ